MDTRVVVIIPARYQSTRFPGKPLATIDGKPMIQHVYERAARAPLVARVLVATDDARIEAAVRSFGGEAVSTAREHASGTDRVAEVARRIDGEIVVNVQGDVPFLAPEMIEASVGLLRERSDLPMATIKAAIRDREELENPNVVKVVTDRSGCAIYFSRSAIPYWRDATSWQAWRHIGLYAYRREFLLRFAALEPTPLERAEKLEQLRALEWGYRIAVAEVESPSIEVDTPADLERARQHALRQDRRERQAQLVPAGRAPDGEGGSA